MSLLKYFKRESILPHPNGPLSQSVPSSSIAAANKAVESILSPGSVIEDTKPGTQHPDRTRGSYEQFTAEEKARIGKRAAEHGVASTVRYFNKVFSDRIVKESSVRTWKKKYLQEIAKRRCAGQELDVKELPNQKTGRPLLLGDELDRQVQSYILELRNNGGVINSAITIAVAQGIVTNFDSNLLVQNGGHVDLTKSWAKYLLRRLGFVKRRSSTKAKISASNFDQLQKQFCYDAKVFIEMMDIPACLVINWDQTGIHYVPVSNWTMEREGLKRIAVTGSEDKRQITATFGATMDGDFLPVQLIYAGKTTRCLPKIAFPADWHVTCTENHWSNEVVMIDYLNKILFPYIAQKKQQLQLNTNHPSLVIFDRFRGQCTDQVLSLLIANNVHLLIVPANCTDRLQPLDISVNKAAKEFLRREFQNWYAAQVCHQMQHQEEHALQPVDLSLAVVKPLGARWMMKLYDYMKQQPQIIKNGFVKAGITLHT